MPARRLAGWVTSPATARTAAGRVRARSNVRTRAVTSQSCASSSSMRCRPRQPVAPVTKTFMSPDEYLRPLHPFDDLDPGREHVLQLFNVRHDQDALEVMLGGDDGLHQPLAAGGVQHAKASSMIRVWSWVPERRASSWLSATRMAKFTRNCSPP